MYRTKLINFKKVEEEVTSLSNVGFGGTEGILGISR